MGFLVSRLMSWMNPILSSNLHNYCILSLLALAWVCSLATLLWPHQMRLDLALYTIGGVCGAMGVVATAHTVKTVRGVEGRSIEPKPDV